MSDAPWQRDSHSREDIIKKVLTDVQLNDCINKPLVREIAINYEKLDEMVGLSSHGLAISGEYDKLIEYIRIKYDEKPITLPIQQPTVEIAKYFVDYIEGEYWLIKAPIFRNILPALLKSLLISEEGGRDRIFSITTTGEEISMIVSAKEKDEYEKADFIYPSGPYLAIAVDTNDPGKDESGILSSLTDAFAKYKISILCCSTYMRNYVLFLKEDQTKFEKLLETEKDFYIS